MTKFPIRPAKLHLERWLEQRENLPVEIIQRRTKEQKRDQSVTDKPRSVARTGDLALGHYILSRVPLYTGTPRTSAYRRPYDTARHKRDLHR